MAASITTTTNGNGNSTTSVQKAVESLLGSRLRCTLEDGRIATGNLVCLDRMRNMILTDCLEERIIHAEDYYYNPTRSLAQNGSDDDNANNNNNTNDDDDDAVALLQQRHPQNQNSRVVIRRLQQAMIPGERLKKVEIAQSLYQTKVAP
eukprot:CAMPEP_0168852074 /NCGR_PEP_ID=MMETSP0727-20121128/12771_1 /TAXON_ID=265536 /ORGANISM="Amphiprora sp., Strain CCMP467" /LENGTH=148 /DNA_ID=CAMNT_0008906149 /DNA_START=62 /DNA_END=504 /DNA_ORIENTATION=-